MGEIGCSWPLKEGEKKVLKAAGRAQKETGVPINIHPGWNKRAPMEILEILSAEGANLNSVIMSHVDRTLLTHESRCEVAKTGCYLEYDAIGREGYFDLDFIVDIPNDNYRANEILKLMDAGFQNRILLSCDVCTKDMCCTYGGHGYAHILRYFVPLLRKKGLTNDEINTLIIDNPRNALTIRPK
jgi:phosphotriesterase-related protein